MNQVAQVLSQASRPVGRSSQVAYGLLKQRILDNDYAPGTTVVEQALCDELGLSRTPVREALVRLEQEGLVEVVPRHGMRVVPLLPRDMTEIYEIMISLEVTATHRLAQSRPSPATLAPLMTACDDMVSALEEDDLAAWARADERFHFSLVDLCGNRRLATAVMGVWEQSHRARMFTLRLRPKPMDSTREHREVAQAILAGDTQKATDLYRAHRERAATRMIEIIERYGLSRL